VGNVLCYDSSDQFITLNLFFFILVLSFFFPKSAPTEIYTLSLHDALPIYVESSGKDELRGVNVVVAMFAEPDSPAVKAMEENGLDRKSTRLNSSHVKISYAVFCLKKKK